jgi:hypothetical protein
MVPDRAKQRLRALIERSLSRIAQCGQHSASGTTLTHHLMANSMTQFPFIRCRRVRSVGRRHVKFLPVAPAATVISAAAKQQHQNNNNEDQFHSKSPLMVTTANSERPAVN